MTSFAPMFGPKQDYAPTAAPATTYSSASPAPTGMSTGTKVGLGVVGLIVVGGGIYLIVSRRK